MDEALNRAQRAHRRAEEARLRAVALRELRLSGRMIGSGRDQVEIALGHARDAYEHLILALQASAGAHERAAARYLARAALGGDSADVYKARGFQHVHQAKADLDQAERLREIAFGPDAYRARSRAWSI